MNPFRWLYNKIRFTNENEYPKNEYPKTVAEVLDDNIKYRAGTDEAMIKFKRSHPWTGTDKEMRSKLKSLNKDLAKVYNIEPPQVVFVKRFYYGCCYFPVGNLIIMEQERDGFYSVVTFLHEFGHALGKGERGTCKWSINLFRKHCPKSFGKLEQRGHLLYRKKKDDSDRTNT